MSPVLGIPFLFVALSANPPVHVIKCVVSRPTMNVHMGTDIGTTESGNYDLHVRFVDRDDEPLTRVVFALNDGARVVDAGKFSPGVVIDHTFRLDPNTASSCNVSSATFADGTRWRAD